MTFSGLRAMLALLGFGVVGVRMTEGRLLKAQAQHRFVDHPSVTHLARLDDASHVVAPFPTGSLATGASWQSSPSGTVISRRQLLILRRCINAGGHRAFSLRGLSGGQNSSRKTTRDTAFAESGGESFPSAVRLRELASVAYIGIVGVGTARHAKSGLNGSSNESEAELRVIYDTGSSDLWIASNFLEPFANQSRRRFNHSNSVSFRFPTRQTAISAAYGSGALHGTLGFDNVNVGSLHVQEQSIGLIVAEDGSSFHDLQIEGIVGLGFASLAQAGTVPLVDNMILQGVLPRGEFAFYLHREPSRGGVILWGGTDKRLHEAELSWFPVVDKTYWALDLVSVAIGEHTFPTRANLLVDSGTTFFVLPFEISQLVHSETGGDSCTKLEHMPPLVFVIRDVDGSPRRLSVQSNEYMVTDSTFGECIPAVVPGDSFGLGEETMILGEVFMRHYFTAFDRGTDADPWPRIGIARARQGVDVDSFFSDLAAREQVPH